jgi:HAD superfamily hydrolase (TIGR01509 family)
MLTINTCIFDLEGVICTIAKYPNIELISPNDILPGVSAFIQEIKTHRIKVVLLTSSQAAASILDQLGLSVYFDFIIDADVVGEKTARPEAYALSSQTIGSSPKNTLVFERTQQGIQAANKSGFYTVGLGYADGLDDAHIQIPSFEYIELAEVLDALSSSVGV